MFTHTENCFNDNLIKVQAETRNIRELHPKPQRASYLFVLWINYERPRGGEEFNQAQKDGTRVKSTRYDQPAGGETKRWSGKHGQHLKNAPSIVHFVIGNVQLDSIVIQLIRAACGTATEDLLPLCDREHVNILSTWTRFRTQVWFRTMWELA